MAEEKQYSHGKHVASDALRGLAVGIRGVLEAKRMAREAKSGRERRIADHYVRLKRLDLQERRLAISEDAAATEMEQVRLNSLQAEQAHKDEWHQRLAETHDRLESLYQERNRAAAPKERERIDNEIAMEGRAVVRLGKNLGYSYPHIEQGLKEREDATIEFEGKSGRIDALDISDVHKAALHTALDSEYSEYRGGKFFGLGTGEDAKVDEILGQLEAIEALDETPEHKQGLKDSYLNEEFGVDASGAEAAAGKEEVLQVLEKNKDAFSEEEYASIKEQIELGEITDSGDFIKSGLDNPTPTMDFGSAEEIVDIYEDVPNRTVLDFIGSAITSKSESERFLRSAHRWLDGRPFEEVDETSKERVARLFINEVMDNVAGGDIVKGHLRAYKILQNRLPALLMDAERLAASGKSVGRLTQVEEGRWHWESESSDPEVTALRAQVTDALNGYMALRSEAEISEAERAFHASMFADIGSGYEENKATIEGLMTHVLGDLSDIYKGVMGSEWGEYAATLTKNSRLRKSIGRRVLSQDFQQDIAPPEVWISEVLKDYGLTGESEIVVPSGADRGIEPSEIVDLLAGDAESIMEAKNLTPEGYVTSVEAQLRKRYPELSDEEIGPLMDEFREKADLLGLGDPTPTEEESEGLGDPTPTEDGTFDRAPKETDFKHRDADGVEYNLHAEVAYMVDIDGWSREKIKAQLQKDYPELSDEQIEAVLDDPEFEYLGGDE
ncbi:MAG: hypothetical protein OYL97_08495 [Candidatus Poribacteria bacterium]|nr:hypothetical protein [Candidatus Poribacteria bacterium]